MLEHVNEDVMEHIPKVNKKASITPQVECILDIDLRWLTETLQTIQELKKQSDTLYSFTTSVLSKKYKLEDGDSIDPVTGIIQRAKDNK